MFQFSIVFVRYAESRTDGTLVSPYLWHRSLKIHETKYDICLKFRYGNSSNVNRYIFVYNSFAFLKYFLRVLPVALMVNRDIK